MRTPRPLPEQLPPAFRVGEARRLGVGRSRLDGADLERPFTGVRMQRQTRLDPTLTPRAEALREEAIRRANAYAARMRPTEFFSHTTAALLWGLPLPLLVDELVDASICRPERASRGAGVRGRQIDPRLVRVTTRNSLRVTTPASTWACLGTVLSPYDLVAVGDAIVCVRASSGGNGSPAPPPLATLNQLRAAIDAGRRPGVGALRDAFGRIRTGSWSRLETWVRLILIDAGLPEPVLNFDAYDTAGRFLGCIDLAYPDLKIAIEYEGDHHWMTAEQFQHDIDRLNRLVEAGWRIVRITKGHVFTNPTEVVRRVSVARAQRETAR
ncbi:hypothetical protein [Mycetocola sp. 2940]|uniref:endonuclease domain-containing protein n=1 Tax=Mycetocola sp. 2940 TaxID=3156452 RepID=UPI00339173E7